MKMIKNIYISLIPLLLIWGCKPEIEVPAPTAGAVDFTKYVAVGNSLTAGYSDGAFSSFSQSNSFPLILATQMNEVSPVDFAQPDVPGNGTGPLYLHALDLSTSPPLVDIRQRDPDPNWANPIPGDYNNLGVTGIRVADVAFNGYAAISPYFNRIVSNPSQSYLDLISASQPTFFTCWLGNNDALGFAYTGGAAGVDGEPGIGLNGLTPVSVFESNYEAVIDALTSGGAKGMVMGIPDVTITPYFTFLNLNLLGLIQSGGLPLPELDAQTAGFLNFVYQIAGYVEVNGEPLFEEGVNFPAIQIGADSVSVRKIIINPDGSGDLLLLPFSAKINEFLTSGLGFFKEPENQLDLLKMQNSALLAATAQALEQAAIAAGTEAATLGAQAEAAAIEAQTYAQASADSAAAGNQEAADSLAALAAQKQQEAEDLGGQALAKQTEAQQLGAQAQETYDQFLATLPVVVPLAKEAANPILTSDVLDLQEQELVTTRIDAYNSIIRAQATASPDITYFDTNALFLEFQQGVFIDGVTVSTDFITGGGISLDGIHPTPRGYAIVANAVMEAINSAFNSTLPPTTINQYPGVQLP